MTAMLFRIVIFLVIGVAIFFGVRRIWRDWKGQFRAEDKAKLERDRRDRQRTDVVTLERGKDGKFRPPGEDD